MARTGVMAPHGPVTPYLLVPRAGELLAFLDRAFAAEVLGRSSRPDGSVKQAAARVFGGNVMNSDATDTWPAMPAILYAYVPDTDAAYAAAVAAGGESVMEPYVADYGDRNAGVRDPSGNVWWFATAMRDVTEEELEAARHAKS